MRDLLVAAIVGAPFLMGASLADEPAAAPGRVAGQEVLRFADPEIVESSGLVVDRGLVITMNDSGDGNRVFTVDLTTGATVGVTRWSGSADDLEALAPAGPGQVWVGDIGDNLGSRSDVTVTRVPVGAGDRVVEGEAFRLTLPGGAHDAEALLAHPRTGRLYVVTKDALGGQLLEAPARLGGDDAMTAIGKAPGLVTDAAFFPDGKHLVLRNYQRAWVYSFPALEEIAAFTLPRQRQGEGIAVGPDGSVYVSSEGADQPLLRLVLPAALARVVGAPVPAAGASAAEPPAPAPAEADAGADLWPWVAGSLVGVLSLGVLIRSLRPR